MTTHRIIDMKWTLRCAAILALMSWSIGMLQAETYNVTYYDRGKSSGSVPVDSSSPYEEGTNVTVLDNEGLLQKSGKVFAGWATSTTNADAGTIDYLPGATITSIAANVDLYPVWKDGCYLIKLTGASTAGAYNTTDFIGNPTRVDNQEACEVNGVIFSKRYVTFGGTPNSGNVTQNFAGNTIGSRFIAYDTKTTTTDIYVYVKNSSGAAIPFYYRVLKEGDIQDVVQIDVAAGVDQVIAIPTISNSGRTRVLVGAGTRDGSDYNKLYIAQIKTVESGAELPGIGDAGYELAVPGRLVTDGGSGTPKIFSGSIDNLEFKLNAKVQIISGTSYASVQGATDVECTQYVKFTTTAATQLQVTTSNATAFYVKTSKTFTTGTDTPAGEAIATHKINLRTADTYYITSTGAQITKIAFAVPQVSYEANGGDGTMSPTDFEVADNGFTAPAGYAFSGWNTDAGGEGDSYAVGDEITDDVTLYAQWSLVNYTISYDLDGGTQFFADTQTSYNSESPTITLHAAAKSGYVFAGWYSDEGLTTPANTIPTGSTGNKTFYAKWETADCLAEGEGGTVFELYATSRLTADTAIAQNNYVDVKDSYATITRGTAVFGTTHKEGVKIVGSSGQQHRFYMNSDAHVMTLNLGCALQEGDTIIIYGTHNTTTGKTNEYNLTASSTFATTIQTTGSTISKTADTVSYVIPAASPLIGVTPIYVWGNSSSGNMLARRISIRRPNSNLVIYHNGDKAGDSHASEYSVESYAGGTIGGTIEYRMKVKAVDTWYSLYLPFTVDSVQVWDEDDSKYYDLVPYYRDGETLKTGHYIIRTPESATDLALTDFGEWNDPETSAWLPSGNTPYIIQWHHSYFENRYVSFFGHADTAIPAEMTVGAAPSSSNVVNIHGNDAMVSGSVAGVYLLENDYDTWGAWLRAEDPSEARTILPFECYIMANSVTRAKYRMLRRGMLIDDTATGWEDVIDSERKAGVEVYSLTGYRIALYTDCSFNETAQRLNAEYGAGMYILRAGNESMKLIVEGGK